MRPAFAERRRARPLLGTFAEISAVGARRSSVDAAIDAAFQAVARVHRLMSFHEPTSDVSRLNHEAAERMVTVHPWTHAVLRAALDLRGRSGGVFDITVAPVLQGMGRLPGGVDGVRPATAAPRAEAVDLRSGHRVRFGHPGTRIDLGGIAKGFAVDQALEVLRRRGMRRGLVNAGGDLAVFGASAETITVRDPRHPGRALCGVAVRDQALASSGGGPAVVIDPRIDAPADAIVGATVLARSCVLADALTKIVMIEGEGAAPVLAAYRASALYVTASGEVHATSDWADRVRRAS